MNAAFVPASGSGPVSWNWAMRCSISSTLAPDEAAAFSASQAARCAGERPVNQAGGCGAGLNSSPP